MKALLFLAFSLITLQVKAQTNAPIKTATYPSAYGTAHLSTITYNASTPSNYVRVWEPQKPYTNEADVTDGGRTVEEVRRATQYFDGLGRPIQTVAWSMSTDKHDLVSPTEYDQYGRVVYNYLPYVAGDNTGQIKNTPFADQANYLQGIYTGDLFFYSKTNYENSPLNRVSESFAPGNSWAGSEGSTSEKSVQVTRGVNDASDAVQIWSITNATLTYNSSNDITPTLNVPTTSTTAIYGAGQLSETTTTDESGNVVVEYKDKEGHVVLKKVQADATKWLYTYYVYDIYGNLRFVIPPKAVAQMTIAGNLTLTSTIVSELCFRYEYDARQRMIAKKVPGAGWVYMVYDKRDRLVFTQDANMRNQSEWMVSFYDMLNRPVMTGMMTSSLKHTQLISNMSSLDYSTTATVSGITVHANPLPSGATYNPLTKTYYNDYSFTTTTYNNTYNSKVQNNGTNVYDEPNPSSAYAINRNMATGTQVISIDDAQDLSGGTWLATVNFYDKKGRLIQSNSKNYKGGNDITTVLYDFTGKMISNYLAHTNPAATAKKGIGTDMEYDHTGKVIKIKKRIYNDPSDASPAQIVKIAENTYDALGRLTSTQLGQKRDVTGAYTATAIETLDYDYNVRGWLKCINKSYNRSTTATNRWFGMELSYDWGFATNQFNGNIAGVTWKTKGDGGQRRSFGYGYDKLNRLLFADFKQYNTNNWADDPVIDFDLKMGDGINYSTAYDENGNIKKLWQKGVLLNSSAVIDDLTYSYFNTEVSNKLRAIMDAGVATTTLGDFVDRNASGTTNPTDYAYDENGNLLNDKNKNLNGNIAQVDGSIATDETATTNQAIIYNYLNLPWKITAKKDNGSIKGTIIYIYDAAGNKLEKKVTENGVATTTTDYIGAFVYKTVNVSGTVTKSLEFFGQEEGRIREQKDAAGNIVKYNFDYFIKDNLGNVRVVLTDEQRQDVYPAATLESNAAALTTEKLYYDIQDGTNGTTNYIRTNANVTNLTINQSQYPQNTYPNNNGNPPYNNNPDANTGANSNRMYLLNGASGLKAGLGITIKVMSGDVVDIYGKSYYHLNSGQTINNNNPLTTALTALLTSFAGSMAVSAAGKGATAAALNGSTATTAPYTTILQGMPDPGTKPKAYLNWILFDEQFRPVNSGSGFDPINVAEQVYSHHKTVSISQCGYLYVYCSNESDVNVYFDNLQVINTRGPLMEENHYNAWGEVLAGISYKAADIVGNKYKYNGKEEQRGEFSDGTGLDLLDYGWRMFDQQLARWNVIDPLSAKYLRWSPYSYSGDNSINFFDLNGQEWVDAEGHPKYADGKYTQYASSNDKRMGDQLQKTATGRAQFDKLVNSPQKITININSESGIVHEEDGSIRGGRTVPIIQTWKDKDKKVTGAEVESAKVVLYEGSIDEILKEAQNGVKPVVGKEEITKDISFIELLAIVLGHEIEHTTDANALTFNQKGLDAAEDEAYKVSDNIIKQTKELHKEDKDSKSVNSVTWNEFAAWVEQALKENPNIKILN
jgi:RHS repeat-associated protein